MKVFAAVIIVSGVWLVLAFALAGCSRRNAGATGHAIPPSWRGLHAEPWMWEQHGSVVSLGQKVAIPPSHPVSQVISRPGR
jgi:hypothetical protein